jgi:hypothetical protein
MYSQSEKALESRARRSARRVGLVARKSRWRQFTIDNLGGFQVFDPFVNNVHAGVRFDLTAHDVIAYCTDDETGDPRS